MVSKIFIFSLIVCTASAATWIGFLPEKPKELAHKEGCYIKDINDVVPFGTELTPKGHCYRIICGTGMVDYASCGINVAGSPNCHVIEPDLSLPYPDCCSRVECDSDNDVNVVS